jgi:hypothetical protein
MADDDTSPLETLAKCLLLVFSCMLAAALVMLFAGCATQGAIVIPGSVTDKPGLSAAVKAGWSCLGRTDTPPKIRIVEGRDLNCTDPNSGKPGFNVLLEDERTGKFGPACRNGFTFLPSEVMVSWTPAQVWSQSTLVHEMEHAKQARNGVIDSHHRRPEWEPGGEVDRCNAQLAGDGL